MQLAVVTTTLRQEYSDVQDNRPCSVRGASLIRPVTVPLPGVGSGGLDTCATATARSAGMACTDYSTTCPH